MNKLALLEKLLLEELAGQKAKRAQFIKSKLEKVWDKSRISNYYKDIDAFVENLGTVDPTANGAYMPWLAKLVTSAPQVNQPEDLDMVGHYLDVFEKNKSQMTVKDINQYKTFADLYDVVAPIMNKEMDGEEPSDKDSPAIQSEIVTIYNGPEGWIKIPTTERSSQYLGKGTAWCTAYTDVPCKFNEYNKRDTLFVIYDKNDKKRTQLHIAGLPSVAGEYNDESNRNLGFDAVPAWAKQPIADWYIKNKPEALDNSLTHIRLLSKWTGKDLSKNTPLEAMVNLMKKFRVG